LALGLRIMPDLQSARFGVINLSFLARLAKAEGKMKYVIIEKYKDGQRWYKGTASNREIAGGGDGS
jgi:hypothetical protein